MKCLLLGMWTWVLLVLLGSGRGMGCLEEERDALLKIKAAFNHPNGSSLPLWRDSDGNCCLWARVECDNITLRVIALDLHYIRDRQSGLSWPWVIDTSLFLSLEELQDLDLSGNLLSGLNGVLNLKRLKRLYLSDNFLERALSLYNQTSVDTQNSSSNQLEGANLEVLDLWNNSLVNDALVDIMKITSLKKLRISSCGLSASKLLEGLCRFRDLEDLDISGNQFRGPLPSCLCNMTSLRVLDVADNNFCGVIPSRLFSNKSLEYIVLSGNAFEGSLSLASLANNSKLKEFFLLDNLNRLEVDTEEPTWFPLFQLKAFFLSNCVLGKGATNFLKEQRELEAIQLSHCGMTGDFPNWLLDNNVELQLFDLRGNNLSGAFHLPSNVTLVGMWWFDVSANIIEGEVPSWIGSVLPNLQYLNLSNNLLKGRIPPSIGNMKELVALDLSNNGFTGEIPKTLAKDCTSLLMMKLTGNNLQGPMLPRYANLTNLVVLYLDRNRFTGDISPGILNSKQLQILDVSHNFLSGTIPNWIGDMESLIGLMLSSNSLEGPLPLGFCNLRNLDRLDLSRNNLGSKIPPCANATFMMRFLHLANNMLAGHFPVFLSGFSSIVILDLRRNALSGEVPTWIGSLWNLKVLLLQGNNFEGSIPLGLCRLKNISILDLSNNNFSGKIPSCLEDLTFGNYGPPARRIVYSHAWALSWGSYFLLNYVPMQREVSADPSDYTEELEEVDFMTKRRLESYKGKILLLMSGMDLSHNNLTGIIPPEFGYFSELQALNLSHNHLIGSVPETFSNLKSIESLDLSYNNLIGAMPSQLTELYELAYFSVAHNNLSGRTPEPKNQFGTFDEASYEGNPLLCGPPLTSCDDPNQEQGTPPSFYHTGEDDSWREAFLWSFAGSYVIAFLGVVLFLYLHPYYRYVLFRLVRKLIPSFPL